MFAPDVKSCHSKDNLDATCSAECPKPWACAKDMELPSKHVPQNIVNYVKSRGDAHVFPDILKAEKNSFRNRLAATIPFHIE